MSTTTTATVVTRPLGHYVDGAWRSPSGDRLTVTDAYTETELATTPAGTAADVDDAVAAASRAFPSWSDTDPAERAALLHSIADGLDARRDELAATIAREVGTPIDRSRRVQVALPIAVLRSFADLAAEGPSDERIGNSVVVREPVGVVGAITPWNYPLYQLAAKVGGALAAGCTVVAKPAQVAPLSAFALAEACDAAGLPAGVLNVVGGAGAVVGEAIAAHPGIDMVSFTGSTAAGVHIARSASATVKRLALELGGKSACVVLDDADLAVAVGAAVGSCFLNSGQTCAAQTRLLVPASLLADAENIAVSIARAMVLGDPLDPDTTMGPLATAGQRDAVRGCIAAAVHEGARLLTGGEGRPDQPHGFFVQPTVFSGVEPGMTIARDEVFGPVLSILAYDATVGHDEAVRLANDSDYGLSGAVWSGSADRALAVARRMRTGQVAVNGGGFNVLAPFGGYKRSGLGRELGRHGLAEFQELKAIQT